MQPRPQQETRQYPLQDAACATSGVNPLSEQVGVNLSGAGQGATPLAVALADSSGRIAAVMKQRFIEIRNPDGSLRFNTIWPRQPVSVAFASDGQHLLVADDAGWLTMLGADGARQWQVRLGCVGYLSEFLG